VAALLLFFGASFFAVRLLKLEGALAGEMVLSLKALAVALPVLLHSLALKGILEAKRRFDLANMVRIPLGIFTYGAPLLVLPFTRSLFVIVVVLLVGRVAAWAWNLWMVFHIMPHVKAFRAWNPARLREILTFGGWVTVSSVVLPITSSIDRIFITTYLSISVVAYYATPMELVSKLWIIAGAVGGTLFPEFASRFFHSRESAEALYRRGLKYLFAVLFPVILLLTAYAGEGLALWLSPEFAVAAAPVLQWLALGTLIGGLAQVPYFFLLGVGRPQIPALLHILELVLYAAALYLLTRWDGIRGAAIAFTLRVLFDFLAQFFFSARLLHFRPRAYRNILLPLFAILGILVCFQAAIPAVPKAVLVLALLAAHGYVLWTRILEAPDKAACKRLMGRSV
jgi:O-antigen/teichoic acid export membrane protein